MDDLFDFSPKRESLYKQVADQLQDLIVAESLLPGEKLPSERELAERMGVSRTVIREAIRVLSDRGLVRAKSGCGTYVREFSHKDAAASIELFLKLKHDDHTFRDVYEVRRMIEVEAAGLAAQRATPEDFGAMERAVAGMTASMDDPEAYTRQDVAFHTAVVTATHNDLLAVLSNPVSDLLTEVVRVSLRVPDAVEDGLTYHRRILRAIRSGDAAQARQAMLEHIAYARELVERTRTNDTDKEM
jgi:GntR family transcriptional repressor for pyruvate dehydrogenase complex